MEKLKLTLTSLIAIGTIAFMVGCGGSQQPATPAPQANGEQSAEHSDGVQNLASRFLAAEH